MKDLQAQRMTQILKDQLQRLLSIKILLLLLLLRRRLLRCAAAARLFALPMTSLLGIKLCLKLIAEVYHQPHAEDACMVSRV